MPKINVEFRARARKAVDDLVLTKWMNEVYTGGREWVRCSELLASYGYGKPTQTHDVDVRVGLASLINKIPGKDDE
jgi:hypothetical protein